MLPAPKAFSAQRSMTSESFAAREQQGGRSKSGGDLAQDEDGFFFQRIQVAVAELAEHLGVNTGVHGSIHSNRVVALDRYQALIAIIFISAPGAGRIPRAALGRVHVVKVVRQAVDFAVLVQVLDDQPGAAPP